MSNRAKGHQEIRVSGRRISGKQDIMEWRTEDGRQTRDEPQATN